eukprot:6192824-Pleurochrysis_carterae.AAC.2
MHVGLPSRTVLLRASRSSWVQTANAAMWSAEEAASEAVSKRMLLEYLQVAGPDTVLNVYDNAFSCAKVQA